MTCLTQFRSTSLRFAAAGIVGFAAVSAHAGVISNPTLFTGPDSIDPLSPDPNAGQRDANFVVPGAATKATLSSQAGWGVVQNFNGATGAPGLNSNFISFTDPLRADVQLITRSGNGSGGVADSSSATSGNPAGTPAATTEQYLGSNIAPGIGGHAQTINFGTYDTTTNTFVANQAVSAVGFTLNRSASFASNWTATYFDALGNTLATQTTAAQTLPSVIAVFGFTSTTANIASVNVVLEGTGNVFFDDLGFTAVPEPASLALLGVGSALMVMRRRTA